MSSQRPGLPAFGQLTDRERFIGIQALLDLVARITGTANGIAAMKKLGVLKQAPLTGTLGGGAVLADVITKVNEHEAVLADLIANQAAIQVKLDAVIARLQED